jgi:Flp pilus assembly protein TadG
MQDFQTAHKILGSSRRTRRGGNAIEFALTMPLFVMLIFSCIEFGYFFFITSLIEDATRQGCRIGSTVSMEASPDSVSTAQSSIESLLETKLGQPCTGENQCTVVVSVLSFEEGSTDTPPELSIEDNYLQCQTAAPFSPAIGFLSMLPSTINTGLLYRLEYQD